MPYSKDNRIRELKRLLAECDDFIKNTKAQWEKDLNESKMSYKKACSNLEKFEVRCKREAQEAIAKGYNNSQMETMKMFHEEERTELKRAIALEEDAVKQAQDYLDKYPALLEGAKADRIKIEAELKALGVDTSKKSGSFLFKLAVWILILLLISKACS